MADFASSRNSDRLSLQEPIEDFTIFSGSFVKLKHHLSTTQFNFPMILKVALASILKTENKTTDLWRSKGEVKKAVAIVKTWKLLV